ncbi:DMT family transporter [Paracoccus sp. DMF-8]|uniref:DMT family transporter n=1 Tax=Paracoccus sp. DMF-8 TaxID=3019445 RepID=UPI0023E46A42|nr:DMT family transporter [Paracoccus sp. DMF-8]MDF3607945.1 DMT family transporter [Paracoccus sp. DMF-8]
MPIYELAALGAAFCWSVTGIISKDAAEALGPFGFARLREFLVALMLLALVLATGRLQPVAAHDFALLALSGIIGIFVGDTILYVALVRIGPRRNGALFSLNAPMAAVLGWAVLGEELSWMSILGIGLASAGVGIAVMGRAGRSGSHRFEAIRGPVWVGILCGVIAALGQALGSLIARPVMAGGFDPYVASLIRVAVATACLSALMALPIPAFRTQGRLTPRLLGVVSLSGFVAMVVGMTLLMFALQGGKVGIVSTLSSLSPVLILPVLWMVTGVRPSVTSWIGAMLAVAGTALIFW